MNKSNFKIPYGKQNIDDDDIKSVLKALKKDLITQGNIVDEFEYQITKKVKSKYAISVNSATSALHIACKALNLSSKEWLWTSPNSFVASANCGLYCNAKIDFVDIDRETCLIDLKILYEKLKKSEKNNTLPKIFIPVHLGGSSCDMKEIYKMSLDFGFSIIEDASHAIGGKYHQKYVGSCEYSSICVFSFHPVKIITTGEGGVATTNELNLYERMRDLRSHGITKDPKRFLNKANKPWQYEQQYLGFNYRITDFQCALGLSQLKKLDNFINERNRLVNRYKLLIKDLPVRIIEPQKEVKSSFHLAIIRFNNDDEEFHLNVFNYFRNHGIGVQIHYIPIHLQPYYSKLGFKQGDFPEAEFYSNNSISIPLFPGLKEVEQDYVVKILREAILKFGS